MRPPAGFAMVGALLALVLVALFGASMADIGRSEALLTRNASRFVHALAALDECAAEVTRALPLGWDFAGPLAGPDAVAGTPDDGTLTAPPPCVASVAALGAAPPRVVLTLESTRGGGRRSGAAVVGRSVVPGARAALWLVAGDRAGRVTGALSLTDASDGVPPWAGIAAPSPPPTLDAWIATTGTGIIPPATAPIWAPPPPLVDVIDAARAAGAVPSAAALVATAPAPVMLAIAEGDLTITDTRWLGGALVVTGHLHVGTGGALAAEGLVVAADGLTVSPGGLLDVQGGLWVGGTRPDLLDVGGLAHVMAHPPHLMRAATMLTLPHEARVLGWSDE